LARVETKPTIYEITLKQTAQPGLPPPLGSSERLAKADDHAELKATEPHAAETEEDGPLVDAYLEEAKRVLLDLIALEHQPASAPAVTINN
jgi:hypothetical protein